MSPLGLIFVGFLLALVGVVLPFLMVAQIIQSTFFLNFFAYSASLAGLFLGVIGASRYIREKRK